MLRTDLAAAAAQASSARSQPATPPASPSAPDLSRQAFSASFKHDSHPVSVVYGYTAVSGSQLLFTTHAAQRPTRPSLPPFLTTPQPTGQLFPPPMPKHVDEAPQESKPVVEQPATPPEAPTTPHRPSREPEATLDAKPAQAPTPQTTPPDATNGAHSEAAAPHPEAASAPHPEAASAPPSGAALPPQATVAKRKFRERAVPSSRLGRALGFAGLGAGLAWGATQDAVVRAFGPATTGDAQAQGVISEANAQRLANALCRMRGARA